MTASTHDRLHAFENKHLGKDHARHEGRVEKGHGSAFAALSPAARAHHTALEELIAAEKAHEDSERNHAAVHGKLQAAIKRAADTEKAL